MIHTETVPGVCIFGLFVYLLSLLLYSFRLVVTYSGFLCKEVKQLIFLYFVLVSGFQSKDDGKSVNPKNDTGKGVRKFD